MTMWSTVGTLSLSGAVALIELHSPGGKLLVINPAEVSSIREPYDTRRHWAPGTHCVITMSNGGVNAVVEDCLLVERLILGGPGR